MLIVSSMSDTFIICRHLISGSYAVHGVEDVLVHGVDLESLFLAEGVHGVYEFGERH